MVVLSIEPINSFWGWGTMKEFGANWLGHIPPLLGRRGGIICQSGNEQYLAAMTAL